MMKFTQKPHFSSTKIGKRHLNEDKVYPATDMPEEVSHVEGLYMVADGAGGHGKGDAAAFYALKQIANHFAHHSDEIREGLSEAFVQSAIRSVEEMLDLFVDIHPENSGINSTIALVYFNDKGANLAWAGNSRIYHARKGKILYQSEDHSLVQEMLKMGQLTEEQSQTHSQRHVLLRALQGSKQPVTAQTFFIPYKDIQADDYFLICSDGVTETWTTAFLEELLTPAFSNEKIAAYLEQACELNSRDNYSFCLVQMGEQVEVVAPMEQPAFVPPIPEPEISAYIPKEQPTFVAPISEPEISTDIQPAEEAVIEPLPESLPQAEIGVVSEAPAEVVDTTLVPPLEVTPPQPEKTLLDQLQKGLEEELTTPIVPPSPKIEHVPPIDTEKVTPPVAPKSRLLPPLPEAPPKKRSGWLTLVVVFVSCLIIGGGLGWLWYNLYGPGSINMNFIKYYKQAEVKVQYCEATGKCMDAKGVVGQAKSAAETTEEQTKVQLLEERIAKKEEEIRQKATFNAPEALDKGKADQRAATTVKSQNPTPKAPQNVSPTKPLPTTAAPKVSTATPPKTTAKAKPAQTTATSKPSASPATSSKPVVTPTPSKVTPTNKTTTPK